MGVVVFTLTTTFVYADPVRIGTTFSKKQCDYLDLDWREMYLRTMKEKFDIIRLGAYWDEIEPEADKYDFTILDWQIEQAKENNIPVLLTVGMKAPRWPEFFIPDWVMEKVDLHFGQDVAKSGYLRYRTLKFIQAVVEHYKDEKIIQYWQVENEALDRSGAKYWWINSEFLKEETLVVRELDPLDRPIVINAATFPNGFLHRLRNLFVSNKPILESLAIADILAINVYPVVGQRFWKLNFYFWTHPKERKSYFKEILDLAKDHDKKVWITELQSEPWEPGHLVHMESERPPTGWPQMMAENFEELRDLGFDTILLWGTEYWRFRELAYEDQMWWDTYKDLKTSNLMTDSE